MASRRARRSSILKTRYDGGSDELFDNNGDGGGVTRNLTGLLKRRVSFSQTNQVKEFEKSGNSSTEDGSLSNQTSSSDFNQTMCDLNMSVYMDDADIEQADEKENQTRVDVNKTRVGAADISVYQTIPTARASQSTFDSFVTDRESAEFNSSMTEVMSKTSRNHNMSIYVEDGAGYEVNQTRTRDNANYTRVEAADISVYQILPAATVSKRSTDHSVTNRDVGTMNSSMNKRVMSKTTCDYNMSVYGEGDDDGNNQTNYCEANKTRVGAADISVYQIPSASTSVSKSNTDYSVADRRNDRSSSTKKGEMSKTTCDYNMSVYGEEEDNCMTYESRQRDDANKTRIEVADISVYQTLPTVPKGRTNPSVTNRNIDKLSSTMRGEMSKTTCDYNMSVYGEEEEDNRMTYESRQRRDDTNKTRIEVADISVYQTLPTVPKGHTNPSVTERNIDKLSSTMRGEMSKTTCDYNMSIYVEDGDNSMNYKDIQTVEDSNKTRVETADISVYQTLPDNASRSLASQSVTNREIDTPNYSTVKGVMSKTTCDYNMSVYTEDGDTNMNHEGNQTRVDANKTRAGAADISVYQTMPTSTSASQSRSGHYITDTDMKSKEFNPSIGAMSRTMCDYNMSMEDGDTDTNNVGNQSGGDGDKTPMGIRQIAVHEDEGVRPVGIRLFFRPTDPQQFLNPLGQGFTANKRKAIQQDQIPKLSFGKFGSAKTPKRNKIPNAIVPETVIAKKSILTNSPVTHVDAQTSPMIKDQQDNGGPSSIPRAMAKSVRLIDVQTSPMLQDQQGMVGNKLSVPKKPFSEVEVQTSPFVQNDMIPKSLVVNKAIPQEVSMMEVEQMQVSPRPSVLKRTTSLENLVLLRNSERNGILRTPPVPVPQEDKAVAEGARSKKNAPKKNILQSPPMEQGTAEILKTHPEKESLFEIISKTLTPPPKERSRGQSAVAYSPILHAESISEAFAPSMSPMIPLSTKTRDLTTPILRPEAVTFDSTQRIPSIQPSQPILLLEESILHTESEKVVIPETSSLPEECDTSPGTEVVDPSILRTIESVPQGQPSFSAQATQAVAVDEQVEEMESMDEDIPEASPESIQTAPFMNEVIPETSPESIQTSPFMNEVIPETSPESIQTASNTEMESLSTPDTESEVEMPIINPQTSQNAQVEPKTTAPVVNAPETPKSLSFDVPKIPSVIEAAKNTPVKLSSHLESESMIVLPKTPLAMEAPKNTTIKLSSHSKPVTAPKTPLVARPPKNTNVKYYAPHSESVIVPQTPSILEASSSTADVNVSLVRRGKPTRDKVSRIMEATPGSSSRSSGFLEIKQKLNTYANDSSLDIFTKWGFLNKVHDKLTRMTEDEWAEVLKTARICEFLGDEFIKAVNTERLRLNDPHPLYQGAMRYIARNKMKNKI